MRTLPRPLVDCKPKPAAVSQSVVSAPQSLNYLRCMAETFLKTPVILKTNNLHPIELITIHIGGTLA